MLKRNIPEVEYKNMSCDSGPRKKRPLMTNKADVKLTLCHCVYSTSSWVEHRTSRIFVLMADIDVFKERILQT